MQSPRRPLLARLIVPAAVAAASVGLVACGGQIAFQGKAPMTVAGDPPMLPAPPPPEAPKPPPRVELKDNKIEIHEKIQFEYNKATIKPASYSLMNEIAKVIKDNPQVKKISIEGHASSEGNKQHNLKLSDQRAKSVMDYLVKKGGIAKDRLTAKGFGSSKPIASNDTEEGREKNRRVEFNVIEQEVTKKKVQIDPATGKEKVLSETKTTVKKPTASDAANKAAGKAAAEAAKKAQTKAQSKATKK